MKRALLSAVAVVLVLSGVVTSATAQDMETYSITIEVTFNTPNAGAWSPGDPCGYDLLTMGFAGPWPPTKQVIITHAGGVIVGTVDLMGPDAASTPIEDWASLQPGTFNDDGYCVVTETLDVTPSPFYTFEIDGLYQWTISADDLEARDWTMQIVFLTQ